MDLVTSVVSSISSTVKNLQPAQWVGIVVAIFLIGMAISWVTSGFENNPNGIRRYVVATDGLSLEEKMHAAQRSSGLTGSRDVPVFFSDYGVEASKDSNGDMLTEHAEGFVDERVTDVSDIEKRFML